MKKSILFGAMAIFAISVMSFQNVEAQNPVKKQDAKTAEVKQQQNAADATTTTAAPAPVKVNKDGASDDCCSKKESKACGKKLSTSTNSGNKVNSKVKPQAKKGHEKASKTKKVNN